MFFPSTNEGIGSLLLSFTGTIPLIGGIPYLKEPNGYSTNVQLTSIANAPLFVACIVIASLSAIPYLIAWIGALVNLARLQQWVWFVFMLIFQWITLLVYLFAGPTTPPGVPPYAQYMPPQLPQNYPQS